MSPASPPSRGSRIPFILAGIFCIAYALAFSYPIYQFIADEKFNAIWIAGLIGWPISLLANNLSDIVGNAISGSRQMPMDLLFMFAFGLFQYGVVGFWIGKALQRVGKAK